MAVYRLLNTYNLDLGQYQYIYLPAGSSKLVISQTRPGFLRPYPEYTSAGSTLADGTSVSTCQDNPWTDAGTYNNNKGTIPVGLNGNVINTNIGSAGSVSGDGATHGSPYMSFTGNLNTYDAVNWTPSSGKNYFLGELSFGNYVNGTYGTYLQPN